MKSNQKAGVRVNKPTTGSGADRLIFYHNVIEDNIVKK